VQVKNRSRKFKNKQIKVNNHTELTKTGSQSTTAQKSEKKNIQQQHINHMQVHYSPKSRFLAKYA